MDPIPETRAALEDLGRTADSRLLPSLLATADRVRTIVPSCTGLSLALRREALTFTLVATSAENARLDAVQHLGGGPCVEGAQAPATVDFDAEDPLDEPRWSQLSRATAAAGVACTLTLPVLDAAGEGVGSFNLYAAAAGAFDGRHAALALVLDAWAPGAVADADLTFTTRRDAETAPQILADRALMAQATGVLMAARGIDEAESRDVIGDVAVRAGVGDVEVARLVIETMTQRDPGA